MCGGPFADRHVCYRVPLPESLMMFDPTRLAYHEYVRTTPQSRVYRYAGFVGTLSIPTDLTRKASQ